MDKECGKEGLEIATNMRGNIQMIKNQDMAFLHGPQEMYIKEIINLM